MLFFLFGGDTFRKDHKLKQMTERFIREVDPSKMNLVVLAPEGIDEGALRSALLAAPFLARKRMIVLKNFLTQKRRKTLHETIKGVLPSLGDDRIVVVSEDEEKPKTWASPGQKAAWEYLEKESKAEQFSPLWGAKLEGAIVALAKDVKIVLERPALEHLALLTGGDLGQINRELQKLGAYCRGRVATKDDVSLLCTVEGEENIFEFLDALGAKEQKALLRTAQAQLEETDPLHLVSRATTHLRALLALTLAGEQGARALKLHPFQAKKISAQMRNWSAPALKRFLFSLLALEYQVKSGRVGHASAQLVALLAKATAAVER